MFSAKFHADTTGCDVACVNCHHHTCEQCATSSRQAKRRTARGSACGLPRSLAHTPHAFLTVDTFSPYFDIYF